MADGRAAVTGGSADTDATLEERRATAGPERSDETRRSPARAPEVDAAPTDAEAPGAPDDLPRRRRRRTLWSDLRDLVGTPARRGRLAVGLAVLAVVVAGPLLARAGVSDARVEVRAQRAERSGAAEARDAVEAQEEDAIGEEAAAAEQAAAALAARNEQRHRLAGLGLNEQTIDAFLVRIEGNAELVEYWRDGTAADVDRQAAEIPQMQECRRVAAQTINRAFNLIFDPDAPVPAPSDLCQALLAAGT